MKATGLKKQTKKIQKAGTLRDGIPWGYSTQEEFGNTLNKKQAAINEMTDEEYYNAYHLEPGQIEEIKQRLKEIENGTAKLISHEEVMKDIEKLLLQKIK